MGMQVWTMRTGVSLVVSLSDRLRLKAVVGDRIPLKACLAMRDCDLGRQWRGHQRHHGQGGRLQGGGVALGDRFSTAGVDDLLRENT